MSSLIFSSSRISSPVDTSPEANFLFGGYSWISKSFELWSIQYSPGGRSFVARPPKCIRRIPHTGELAISSRLQGEGERLSGNLLFAGDQAAVGEKLLIERLNNKSATERLDMEPFEVVRDMLRDGGRSETIGGAPQLIKVYQYMRTAPIGVFWPDKASGKVHLQGRPCLGYERIDRWVLDPDTLRSERQPDEPDETEDGDR
jgi:hypothetical protein